MIETCEFCGEKLTKREDKVYYEISDGYPCYCATAKRIVALEKQIKRMKK